MEFLTNKENLKNEMLDVVKIFEGIDNLSLKHTQKIKKNLIIDKVKIEKRKFKFNNKIENHVLESELLKKRYEKRIAKTAIYKAMSSFYNQQTAWGSLTGIRPTKLYYQLKYDEKIENIDEYFKDFFDVSEKKLDIVKRVVQTQQPYYNKDLKSVDIYVGIPFCVSRCSYCSFISAEISKCQSLVEPYLNALKDELSCAKEIINSKGLNVRAVYVGGGTPTSITATQLDNLLKNLNLGQREFTVECGRPDTITKEKLDAVVSNGGQRISINPQTFNQQTLNNIGRKHTIDDIYNAFNLAKQSGVLTNVDLIAGLDGDDFDDFCNSVKRSIALDPDNITVHTLCLKQGSEMRNKVKLLSDNDVSNMVDFAYEQMLKNDFNPYYMYRQKYMAGHNENIGYSKKGKECIYNIDTMEENTSIMAFGANAVSKVVLPENRIERQGNAKDITTYIKNIEQQKVRKTKLFEMLEK